MKKLFKKLGFELESLVPVAILVLVLTVFTKANTSILVFIGCLYEFDKIRKDYFDYLNNKEG